MPIFRTLLLRSWLVVLWLRLESMLRLLVNWSSWGRGWSYVVLVVLLGSWVILNRSRSWLVSRGRCWLGVVSCVFVVDAWIFTVLAIVLFVWSQRWVVGVGQSWWWYVDVGT